MPIKVVTDSACDLSAQMAEDRGVRVVPLTIRFGDEELVDRQELSTKEFWDRVTTGTVMPETAAPAPGAFQEAFLDAAAEGADGVLCVTLSSGVSATYQAARTAAGLVADRIQVAVVDSLSMTMGLGLLVVAAVDLAQGGAALEAVEAEVVRRRDLTRVFGVIDSLEFLKRGGRIGGAAQLMGSLLSIKPVIEIRNGVVEVESRQRTRSRSLQYLASKALDAGPIERLAVANGAASDIDELLGALEKAAPAHEMLVTELGPVIGAHGGPGTIGLCFQLQG
ncbi:MAG TPA: DegV family protein [Acidimicrobiales bacterium]|nr:DegV family protein [Acidimicrobiales bacterium]